MNPLERRKNLLEEDIYHSTFDYSEIEVEDKEKLIEYEQQIKVSQTTFVKSTLDIGRILLEAQEKLKAYKIGTFMNWYENLGFNKDNVSYFLKRYDLSLKFPQKRDYIAEMPVRVVKELTKKNVEKDLVKEAIAEEVKSTKELKSIQLKYSHSANIITEKIIKTKVEKLEVRKMLKEILNSKVSNKELDKAVEKLFENYKIIRK